jgi:hypothetical protein
MKTLVRPALGWTYENPPPSRPNAVMITGFFSDIGSAERTSMAM